MSNMTEAYKHGYEDTMRKFAQDAQEVTDPDERQYMETMRAREEDLRRYHAEQREIAELMNAQQAAEQNVRGDYPGRRNNPFNMRFFNVGWLGELANGLRNGDFTRFDTAQNGLRGGIRYAIRMPERGVVDNLTIRNYVHNAAPASDGNDEEQHAANIARISGLGVDDVLDTSDDGTMVDFARGVTQAESGADAANWYTPQEYTNAVQQARIDM